MLRFLVPYNIHAVYITTTLSYGRLFSISATLRLDASLNNTALSLRNKPVFPDKMPHTINNFKYHSLFDINCYSVRHHI